MPYSYHPPEVLSAQTSAPPEVTGQLQGVWESYREHISTIDPDNWGDRFASFLSEVHTTVDDERHAPVVRGWLAHMLEKSYDTGRAQGMSAAMFGEHLDDAIGGQPIPDYLKTDKNVVIGKRQPSLQESIDGTLDRLHFMEQLPGIFGEHVESIIVGGSMSYGPFYNIRQRRHGSDSSDVDAIFVVRDSFMDPNQPWNDMAQSNALAPDARQSLATRRPLYTDLRERGQVDVISQRFEATSGDFNMSAHLFPAEVFDNMVGAGLKADLASGEDRVAAIRDYKPRRFEHPVCAQQNFYGEAYRYEVPEQDLVVGGLVARIPSYIIHDDKLHPGLYQNLISPDFKVLYDDTGRTTAQVEEFKQTLDNRVTAENAVAAGACLVNSHIRKPVFASGRYPTA